MSDRRKIAFLKQGLYSHINQAVEGALRGAFPEHELEVIDVANEFMHRHSVMFWNTVWTWLIFGPDLLAGRRRFWDCYYRTRRLWRRTGRHVGQRLAGRRGEFAFTFQTQTLFDARVPGLPHFLYTDHAHLANLAYATFDRGQLLPGWYIEMERALLGGTRRIFTMSRHVERAVTQDYRQDPRRVECVFAGPNAPILPTSSAPARYARQEIVFNGVEWERKGGPDLAAAFRRVLQKHPDAWLTIVGCRPAMDLPNSVSVGAVPLEEVSKHYARASVFCLPTQVEPFGIAFVEALHHRLPIVAANHGAAPDMIENGRNGTLVPPGNVDQLARALEELLASPETCSRYGEAGFALARQRYTWEAVGKRLGDGIRAALEERQASKAEARA